MADVFGHIDGWWNDLSRQSSEKIPPSGAPGSRRILIMSAVHFPAFGALTWAGNSLDHPTNLSLPGDPRLARLQLRGTWGTKLIVHFLQSGAIRISQVKAYAPRAIRDQCG